jgi:serpin B
MRSPSLLLLLLPFSFACDKSTTTTSSARPVNDPASSAPAVSTGAAPSAEAPVASTPPAPAVEPPKESSSMADGSNAFAIDFWAKAASKKPGNLAFSPASISIAFAMTAGGAKGETAAQMKKAMHFSADPAEWGTLSRALTGSGRTMKLRIANRLYGEKTYTFEQPYLDLTKNAFDAPLERMDFKGATDPSRVAINKWVEQKTEQRIKDLLPAAALDSDTRLVLVNAIYFLADWANQFEKERTSDKPFEVDAKTKKNVPTMFEKAHFGYAAQDGVKIVQLPYKNDEASMFVVLPDKKDGLADVERGLTKAKLDAWTKAVKSQDVELSLPRFEIATPSMQLAAELSALGMPDAFDKDKADFTAIANPPKKADRLYIAKVFHKAFVKVDEKGTEAAAATAVVMAKGGGMPQKGIEMVVDHPFLFFIVDKQSGLVLFMGRVVDPSTKG